MAKPRSHLSHAPISEALIDLHVRQRKNVGLSDVQALASKIDGYQSQGPILTLQTKWTVSKERGAEEASESKEIGVRLQSDEKYVLQVRTNGFTLSRLEPYERWEHLVTEARRLWDVYRSQLEPEVVVRVATRFINQLKLPMKQGEQFEEYLTKPPQVPESLPQGVLGFIQRMVLVKPDIDIRANVIQLLPDGPPPGDHVPVVLDIDVYKPVELAPATDEAWKLLEELRVFKNEIFFAHISERTARLFE